MRTHLTLALAVASLAGTGAIASAATTTHTDRVGDTTAADLRGVTVVDGPKGLLTFRVAFANRVALRSGDRIWLYLDTDRNQATGRGTGPVSKRGADYQVFLSGRDNTFGVYRLDRAGKTTFLPTPSARSRCCATGAWTISLLRSAVGNPSRFNFYVYTRLEDPKKRRFDYAPVNGTYRR